MSEPTITRRGEHDVVRKRKATVTSVWAALIAFLASLFIGLFVAPAANADPNGNCGGFASNTTQLLDGWKANHVVGQVANEEKSAGYNPLNGSLGHWLNERVVRAQLASAAEVTNFGCRGGVLFSVGTETQPKGHWEFGALPSSLAKSDVSTTFVSGWVRTVIRVRAVADSGCGNPNGGWITIVIWKRPPPPKPSFSCTGMSVTHVSGKTYRFTIHSSVRNTTRTGFVFQLRKSGSALSTVKTGPAHPSLRHTFSTAGSYRMWGKVKTKAGTTPFQLSCSAPVTIKPPPPPSFSCTGLTATPNGDAATTMNYTFAVTASVTRTTVTGSSFTVVHNGNVIATVPSSTLSANYTFPQPSTYTVKGKVNTAAGTTPFTSVCTTTVTIQPPPKHTTTISCQLQEEITGGDASQTYCTVVSDVSVPSTINVTTSDNSALYVTGIECTDNSTASCDASPGHYQFTLHGVNDGSTAIYRTLTVSATANGVTTNPPFTATVKIDPSCISFGCS